MQNNFRKIQNRIRAHEGKGRWIYPALGCVFLISLVLNFLQYFLVEKKIILKPKNDFMSSESGYPAAINKNEINSKSLPEAKVFDILEKGDFEIKRIKNVVIDSIETINNTRVTVQVFLDQYFPEVTGDDSQNEKFPLVIISHPTIVPSMSPARAEFDYLAEHLVSHGYIVVIYEWSFDMGQCELFRNAEREENIVKYFQRKNDDEYSPLYQLIDINKIGLIGHSNGAFAQYFSKMEPKVKAFAGLSGLICEWGGLYQDIVDLKKPFMYIGATKDQLRANTDRLKFYGFWDSHTGPKVMLDVKDGDHWQFTDDYIYFPDIIVHYSKTDNVFKNLYEICQKELKDNDPGNDAHCKQEYISRDKQHEVVKYFMTAFFDVYLKNKTEEQKLLKNPLVNELITNFKYENLD